MISEQVAAVETGDVGAERVTDLRDGRCVNIRMPTANATAITTTALIITHFSPDGLALGPEIAVVVLFLPRRFLNFSGGSGLPSSSV